MMNKNVWRALPETSVWRGTQHPSLNDEGVWSQGSSGLRLP
eukprot:CAMPEP_0175609784 /NCGR_PEP_ID=MMETSP0096-20121207/62444_1 /TAXON_ID=311494 /ORGANISM="Alexandrium monilatum, Strain CCMP3105" /LENGTH=40 /DNA_ID= /DNA_START= /DNA_END= /DNA_ORIENTATION=